ncbi:MAG: hypothetical protein HDP34_01800 [Clostridia bacterium]|nr:hypothetical protein [Clostridia bacterium]
MTSIIEDFYYYECDVCEGISNTEKYNQDKQELLDLCDKLDSTLNEKQKEMLSRINTLYGELELETEKTAYRVGFKSGVLLGMEVSKDNYT